MVRYYPIAISLKNKRAFVIGGGKVAQRKIRYLLNANAKICVISPALTPELFRLVDAEKISWKNKCVEAKDLLGADIVIAATSDAQVNKNLSNWAGKLKILINIVDQPALSSFISPAVFKKSKAIVAVYTDGKDPVLSRDLKNFLEENWNEFLSYRHKL